MDYSKLTKENGIRKNALYILNNMKGCAKEVWNSAKTFGKNIGGLFMKSKRPDAVSFFRDSVFSIKPKQIIIKELINQDGEIKIATAFKNNPYLMHAASLVLAVGGATLALSSVFKNKKGQKIGLKTYEAGGSLDNISLSRSGLEKAAISSHSSGRLAGNLLGLSGAAILAGQPGVDEKWGRGTQWLGTSLLFAVFAVERSAKAFKSISKESELTSLVRQWEVDLTKLYTKSELSEKIAGSKFKTRLDSIISSVKNYGNKDGVIEDKKFESIVNALKNTLENKSYNQKSSAEMMADFEKHIMDNNKDFVADFKKAFRHEGNDGDAEALTDALAKESEKIFQKV